MMIILTAAALAATQPAPAPQTPAAHPAGQHAGHSGHGQAPQAQGCSCCNHGASAQGCACCAQHRQQPQPQPGGHDGHQ